MESTTITKRFLNYEGAARYTSLSRTTLWRAVRAGVLEPSGDGRGRRFGIEELDRFMQARRER